MLVTFALALALALGRALGGSMSFPSAAEALAIVDRVDLKCLFWFDRVLSFSRYASKIARPLTLLRTYTRAHKPIVLEGDQFVFGRARFPRSTVTASSNAPHSTQLGSSIVMAWDGGCSLSPVGGLISHLWDLCDL